MKAFDFKLLFKLWPYVKPYRLIFFATIFVSICFGALSTIRPLLIQYAFDNYIMNADVQGLINIILIILICLLFEAYLQFIFVFRSNYLAQKIIQKLRSTVFLKILRFQVSYFDKTPVGQLITRVVSDMEAISSIFSQGLLVFFGDLFKMLLIIICMFLMSWELALISLACLPFLIFATIIFQRHMHLAFVDVRKYISEINTFVYEHIIGMHVVQLFGKEKEQFNIFKKLNAAHRDAHIKTVFYFSVFLPIIDVCSAIAMGMLVWYGALNVVSVGNVTIGEMIAFILFINMLFRPLRSMADKFNVLQMGGVAARRVFNIVESKNNEEESALLNDKLSLGDIVFKNVNFEYKKNEPVLKDINFKIKSNETVAIIGPTGSGKTTIVNLIMKWYAVKNKTIFIDDDDINNINVNQLRLSVGVVLQDSFFLSDTLMNNIKFFNDFSDKEVYDAVKKVGLEDFIYKFPDNYNYYIGERGVGLSQGEKQLISFLRTYLINPPYLILDEATSSMDPETDRLIQGAIKHLTQGRTSIIIAHRLSTIKSADNIFLLENGRLIEMGTHEKLLSLNGKYANYYYQQFINN